ncbi:MAG: hypothetical protein A2X55_04870 [Nitrospirae bacterium GWB2_47_37]|nr:MAG: hypothetical protein A2X55_04870 [Nitrospirae bacterium GWB2_47_37]
MGLYPSSLNERKRIEAIFDQVANKVAAQEKDIASLKTVIDKFNLHGKSILEVGCGMGDNLIYCSQKGAIYAEGFDISGESIKIAQEKAKGFSNILFHKCSIEEYNSEKNFNFILAWGVFEYVDNPLESLKKMVGFLSDEGILMLLISRPIFIKRISFIIRAVLSKMPLKTMEPLAKMFSEILKIFSSKFKRMLYTGESNTYTFEQTILEGLMVPRYNIFRHEIFTNYLQNQGFLIDFFYEAAPSMTCIIAKKYI